MLFAQNGLSAVFDVDGIWIMRHLLQGSRDTDDLSIPPANLWLTPAKRGICLTYLLLFALAIGFGLDQFSSAFQLALNLL